MAGKPDLTFDDYGAVPGVFVATVRVRLKAGSPQEAEQQLRSLLAGCEDVRLPDGLPTQFYGGVQVDMSAGSDTGSSAA